MHVHTAAPHQNGSAGPAVAARSFEPAAAAAPVLLLQRKQCACGGTAGPSGECEECRRKREASGESQIRVNEPGDALEQEADRVAETVANGGTAMDMARSTEEMVQRKTAGWGGTGAGRHSSVREVISAPGDRLDGSTRSFMESRFGHDFGSVRIHTGSRANESARAVGASAYTVGPHVVWGTGSPSAGSRESRKLLAHELTHVLQQRRGQGGGALQRQGAGIIPMGPLEVGVPEGAMNRTLPPRKGQAAAPPPRSPGPVTGAGRNPCLTGDACKKVAGSASEFGARTDEKQEGIRGELKRNPAMRENRGKPRGASAVTEVALERFPQVLRSVEHIIVDPSLEGSGAGGFLGDCSLLGPVWSDPALACIHVSHSKEAEAEAFLEGAETIGPGMDRLKWELDLKRILTHESTHAVLEKAPPGAMGRRDRTTEFELNELGAILSEIPVGAEYFARSEPDPEERSRRFLKMIQHYVNRPGQGIRGILTKMRCLNPCDQVDGDVRQVFAFISGSWSPALRNVFLVTMHDPTVQCGWPVAPPPRVQLDRMPGGEAAFRENPLRRKPSGSKPIGGERESHAAGDVLRAPGRPLDADVRGWMESRFDHDFSRVRVHTGGRASESARALGAAAYTWKRDVVFDSGRYEPRTAAGRLLLAHELGHVVQNDRAGGRSLPARETNHDPHSASEREATAAAARAVAGHPARITGPPGARVQTLPVWAAALLGGLVGAGFAGLGMLIGWGIGKLLEPNAKEKRAMIEKGRLAAGKWVKAALVKLNAFVATPGGSSEAIKSARAALQRHFHATDPATAVHVRDRIAAIDGRLDNWSNLTVRIQDKSDGSCRSADAYVSGGNAIEMVFCPSFFKGSEKGRTQLIVHEVAHTLTGGDHITDRGYMSDRVYPLLSAAEALINAESYGMLVREVATGMLPASGGPADTGEDCPAEWKRLLDIAIARGQRWNRNALSAVNNRNAAWVQSQSTLMTQHLGGSGSSELNAAAKVYGKANGELKSKVEFECEPKGGGRCDAGHETYWFGMFSDFHICPAWRNLTSEPDRIESLLRGFYGYAAEVGNQGKRAGYAKFARCITNRSWPAPGETPDASC